MIRSVYREQDVVYQWCLVCSCICIPFLWWLCMPLAQSCLLLLHIFTLKFVIRIVLRGILVVSEWFLICGSISIDISHFHRFFGSAYSDTIHGIWKFLILLKFCRSYFKKKNIAFDYQHYIQVRHFPVWTDMFNIPSKFPVKGFKKIENIWLCLGLQMALSLFENWW